ncbi:MAG: hypothetical protein LBC43_04480, partial [Bifidobacteriaceae bacterium]|nr:hypothetical protein [Bifidobacteriaceae bacterium]
SSSSQPKPQPSKSTAPKPQPSSGGSGSSSFDDCATNPKCYHYADSSVTRWSKRSASPNPDTIFDDYDYSIVQAVYSNDDSASDTPDNSLTTYLWLGGSVLAVAGGLVLGAIRPWSRRKLEKLS